ncbi:MAG: hypothetical protein AAGD01_03640 [Acidobacteriota bacterium]
MEYQGNPSLSQDVHQRIQGTFQQSLESARKGDFQEALLGCDFILRLDPEYAPAKRLAAKVREVMAQRAGAGQAPAAPAPAQPNLLPTLNNLLERRNYQQILEIAQQHRDLVAADPKLAQLVETATERLQAQSYVQGFLQAALQSLESGDLSSASDHAEKARSLDPQHPGVIELQQRIEAQRAQTPASFGDETIAASSAGLAAGQSPPGLETVHFDDALLSDAALEASPVPPGGPESGQPGASDPEPLAAASAASSDDELGDWELPEATGDDPLAAIDDPLPADPLASPDLASPDLASPDLASPDLASPDLAAADSVATDLGFSDAALEDDPLGAALDDPLGSDLSAPAAQPQESDFSAPAASPAFDPLAAADTGGLEAEVSAAPAADADDELDFSEFESEPAPPPIPEASALGLEADDELSLDDEDPFAAGSSDSRVQELLNDGQGAFDRGDYQGAIDAWSRIFLIDVDHPEASNLIEQARKLKDEGEREVEEVFHEAVAAMDAGQHAAAKEGFEKILSLQPEHAGAQEYLAQLESGTPPPIPGAEAPAAALSLDESLESSVDALEDGGGLGGVPADLADEIMMPPEPGGAGLSSDSAPPPPPAAKGKARRNFMLIGGLVLLLVVAAGAYVFLNFDDLFRNADTPVNEQPRQRTNPIEEAQKLYERGRQDVAVGRLERIPENSRYYEDAQKLLAEWSGADAEPEDSGELDPEQQRRFEELLATADVWVQQGQYLRVREPLLEASQIAPLPSSYDETLEIGRERANELNEELLLFQDGDWEAVLPDLWRVYVADESNGDVKRLIVDSYYNIGVRSLQRGDLLAAKESFEEVLDLQEDDVEAQRHYLFADTYERRDRDLLFRIYVKYLPFR